MSDEAPEQDEAPGWRVLDPDGNVVASGPVTEATSVFLSGETSDDEGEQE